MKKYYLLLLVLFYFSKTDAQFSSWGFCGDCFWGIESGVAFSNISGMEGASAKSGFYIGFNTYHPIDYDKFDIRTGVTYTSAGAKIEGFKNPLVIHSINTPLVLHYRPVSNFQVFGGGEIGINMFGRQPSNVDNPNSLDNFDFMDNFTFLDVGIVLGSGLILFDVVDINLSYTLGVTNISKVESENWKKNMLRLSIGYSFRDW